MKRAVKQIFGAMGIDIRRAKPLSPEPSARMTMRGFLEHCKSLGFMPGGIFDVGVAEGTFEVYEAFRGVPLMLVEPVPEFEPVLKEFGRVYGAEYVLAAASDRNGTTALHVHTDNLNSSSLLRESEGEQVDGVAREVRTVRLDELAGSGKLVPPYLIKVDVQGAELRVLDGASKILPDAEIIILELSLFGFFIGGPQLFDVLQYMMERGFIVYDFFGVFYRPLDGALGQIDVAFVKENGPFRKIQWCATPEQRAACFRNNNIPATLAALRSMPAMKRSKA